MPPYCGWGEVGCWGCGGRGGNWKVPVPKGIRRPLGVVGVPGVEPGVGTAGGGVPGGRVLYSTSGWGGGGSGTNGETDLSSLYCSI